MKNLLALVGLAIVGVGAAGWYCGWYTVKTAPGQAGHRTITVDVNAPEVVSDLKKGAQKVHDVFAKEVKEVTNHLPPSTLPTSNVLPPGNGPVFPTPDGGTFVLPPLEPKFPSPPQ